MVKNALKSVLLVMALVLFAASPSLAKGKTKAMEETPKAVEMREALRGLWGDHIFWVRNVVLMTKLGDAEAAKVAEASAVENARAIADAVIPYYGQAAADQLFGLLAGHYGAVKGYMTVVYAGNTAGKEGAVDKIMNNATAMAVFLSSANPNWPKETLESLLFAHGAHHIAQIDALNAKDYSAEAQNWEAMKNQMNVVADALGRGIVKQFPKKF